MQSKADISQTDLQHGTNNSIESGEGHMNEDLYSQQEVQKEGRNTRTIQEKDTNTAQKNKSHERQ